MKSSQNRTRMPLQAAIILGAIAPIAFGGWAANADSTAPPTIPVPTTETAEPSPTDLPTATATAEPTVLPSELPTAPLPTATPTAIPTTSPPTSTPTGIPTTSPPTSTPTPTGPTQGTSGEFEVDDAQLRWGVNNESNNRAFAPGTFNFFSAGEIPNPGKGGQQIAASAWQARDGDVRIEKAKTDGSYATATWAGLQTARDGTEIPSPTSGKFSDHQMVFDGGTGTIDPSDGTAQVAWEGTVTVIYYSGMSYFTITDPMLTVTAKKAQVRATLSGYGADMNDPSVWKKLPPTEAVIADLPRTEMTLPDDGGFTVTPAYAGVRYQPKDGGSAQVSGPNFGSFPTSMVDFLDTAGSAGYWYSTGGSTDPYKPALPMTINYSADENPGESTATPSTSPEPTARVSNNAPPPPSQSSAQQSAPSDSAAPTAPPPSDMASPTTNLGDALSTNVPAAYRPIPTQVDAYVIASTATPTPQAAGLSAHPGLWLLGCVLLLLAGVLTLISALTKGNQP